MKLEFLGPVALVLSPVFMFVGQWLATRRQPSSLERIRERMWTEATSLREAITEEVDRLRKEVTELRHEIAALRLKSVACHEDLVQLRAKVSAYEQHAPPSKRRRPQ